MTRPEKPAPRKARKRPPSSQDAAFYESLGHAVKVIRTQRRMERKELAEAAGVSYAYLSDIETGRGRPSSSSLLALAEALEMAPHELMFAAESSREALADEGPMMLPTPAAMAAPSARLDARRSRSPEVKRASGAPSPADTRAELAAAIDELDAQDLEMVLDLVHRLQGKRRKSE